MLKSTFDATHSRVSIWVRMTLSTVGLLVLSSGCTKEMDEMKDPLSVSVTRIDSDALFVVNGGTSSISVINATTNEVIETIALQNAPFPHHLYISPDQTMLSLAIPGMDLSAGHGAEHGKEMKMGAILILDAATGKTIASRTLDASNHNAVFSPDGKEIWTSQMTMPGKVLVLNALTLKTQQSIVVGDMPAEVTFSKDGKYTFSANGMSNNVTVMDAVTKAVVKTIPVGGNPVGAWQGGDGIMYIDNEMGKSITAVDASTLEIVRTYNLGFMPGMAATSPSGDLWVTDSENGKVVIYTVGTDVKSGEVITGAGAHAVTFSGNGKFAYVSNQGANTLSVIDIASKSILKTITVGEKPNGMLFRAKK